MSVCEVEARKSCTPGAWCPDNKEKYWRDIKVN